MKRLLYYACACGMVVLMGMALPKIYSRVTLVERYCLWMDPLFSESTRLALHEQFQKIEHAKLADFSAIVQAFAHHAPVVREMELRRCPSGVMHIALHAHETQALVNERYVATLTGRLLPRESFTPWLMKRLPSLKIVLDATLNLHDLCKKCLTNLISLSLCYHVAWYSKFYVVLTDKQQPLFSIVCHHDHIPNASLLESCCKIKEKLEKENKFVTSAQKVQKRWIADVRFARQIVLYAHGKEEAHG